MHHSFTEAGFRISVTSKEKTLANISYSPSSTTGIVATKFTLKNNSIVTCNIFNGYREAGKSYRVKGLRITAVKELPWEPYKSVQTLTLPTPNGLPGIKVNKDGNYTDATGQQWIVDEIDLARGKYVQRVCNIKIDESLIKTIQTNWEQEDKISYRITVNLKAQPNQKCLSNRFAFGSHPYLLAVSGQSIYLEFADKKEMPTVENFKQFLKNNETTILYILKTPIERDLTPEEIQAYKALHSNYPTTVILNDENAGMEVSYVADTKNYIDKKFAELNQAIVNTQISLL